MGALEKQPARPVVVRPQIGLMLSIGEPPEGARNYPKKLDHFRPKPGTENQYAPAVAKFVEVFGAEPKVLDVVLLSHAVNDVLDIRLKAWGTSGLRAIGQTNYALTPEHMLAYDDVLTTFPENQPGAVEYRLQGPDDPAIAKTGLKLYGVFRFSLPRVTGLTTMCEISTTSKRSMLNLLAGVQQILTLTGGHMAGIPLELAVRPARTRFFDEKKKKRTTSTFYELVLQAPQSLDEFFATVALRRRQMALGDAPRLELPPVVHDDAERDLEIAPGLWRSPEEERVLGALEDLPAVDVSEDVVDVEHEELAGEPNGDNNTMGAHEVAVGSEQAHAPEPSPADEDDLFTQAAREKGLIES